MIKSMTGYGRGEAVLSSRLVSAEIRAVNHRYCEVSLRLPGRFGFAEDKIKQRIKQHVGRGKIDAMLHFSSSEEEDVQVTLNNAAARQYFASLRELQKSFDVTGEITIDLLSSMPDVLHQDRSQNDEEAILSLLLEATDNALTAFDEMRASEGAKLQADLEKRLAALTEIVKSIEKRAPEVRDLHTVRLKERIAALLEKTEYDAAHLEQRLTLEIAVAADKMSIEEELVRLFSHIDQFRKNIQNRSGLQPVGKKLDFIVQEMNREANTIGSKANDLRITDLMIELKSGIENIREQVQNIE